MLAKYTYGLVFALFAFGLAVVNAQEAVEDGCRDCCD